jgi:hypothetical protein
MKKHSLLLFLLLLSGLIQVTPLHAGEWRIPFGFSYVGGASDFLDQIEDNLEAEGYTTDTFIWPVGITVQPYYEFDFGLGIGFGAGPVIFVQGDADAYLLPVNASLRYAILPWAKATPYVRAGVSQTFAGGDFIEGSSPGYVIAFGAELLRHKAVGIGFEIGYDSSVVEMEDQEERRSAGGDPDATKDIHPVGLIISIQAIF